MEKLFSRDEKGLVKGVEYKFNSSNQIDWRAMVDPQFLYPNKENFQRRGEQVPDKVDGLKDSDLVIMLGGLKTLCSLRGFTSVTYRPVTSNNEYSAVVCQVQFIGNYETEMQPVVFEECGSANLFNTSELVQTYLLEIATNRAFCRCVRNFLKINIVSDRELPPQKKTPKNGSVTNLSPSKVLAELMKEKGRSFEELKSKLIGEGDSEFLTYESWSDIPGDKAFQLVDRFKNLKETKRK